MRHMAEFYEVLNKRHVHKIGWSVRIAFTMTFIRKIAAVLWSILTKIGSHFSCLWSLNKSTGHMPVNIHSFIYLAIQHTNAFGKYKYIYMQQKQRLQSTKATSAA